MLYLPLLIALGIGLSLSSTQASSKTLFRIKSVLCHAIWTANLRAGKTSNTGRLDGFPISKSLSALLRFRVYLCAADGNYGWHRSCSCSFLGFHTWE
jgi:hypothetical protein